MSQFYLNAADQIQVAQVSDSNKSLDETQKTT